MPAHTKSPTTTPTPHVVDASRRPKQVERRATTRPCWLHLEARDAHYNTPSRKRRVDGVQWDHDAIERSQPSIACNIWTRQPHNQGNPSTLWSGVALDAGAGCVPISASTTPLGLVDTTRTATLAAFRRPPRSYKPPNGGWRRAPGTSSVRVGDVETLPEVIAAPTQVQTRSINLNSYD